jgi:hypothetical protein
MLALVAITFVGALAASTTADARWGGSGGGFRGGGMHTGGGWRGGMRGWGGGFRPGFAGSRFRSAGFVGRPFLGPRRFAFHPGFSRFGFRRVGFAGRPFFGPRRFAFRPSFARFNRFGFRRFGFAVAPFAVGVDAAVYGDSCWGLQPTPWGWQQVWLCGGGYSAGFGYGGAYGYGYDDGDF